MAGATQLDVYNLALSHLKTGLFVQSLTEQTPQAGYCNRFYDRARKWVLEQGYWSFATKAAALALLLDQSTLTNVASILAPGWRFIYARPQDCLKAQAVTNAYGMREHSSLSYWFTPQSSTGSFGGSNQFRPPWKEVQDQINTPPGQSIDIVTDEQLAWLIYTTDVAINICPETFVDCIAWVLATLIGPNLHVSTKSQETAERMAPLAISRAFAQNLMEEQPDDYPESPAITARR